MRISNAEASSESAVEPIYLESALTRPRSVTATLITDSCHAALCFSPNFVSRLRNLARNQAARHQWLRFHKQTIVAARKDHWSALPNSRTMSVAHSCAVIRKMPCPGVAPPSMPATWSNSDSTGPGAASETIIPVEWALNKIQVETLARSILLDFCIYHAAVRENSG